ncbi:MAG TPA: hypothetical protein VJJ51_05500 [Candidatus Methanoperedens sp.]|nr:hypothetical protein [Candidatus Methanoperedens sp.]HLB70482.1 hypothetical protein [Candidatus Methanoperedens sp.]
MVKVKVIYVDAKKAQRVNDILRARIETEEFDRSIMKSQRIIGLKEYLEGPLLEK